MELSYDEEEGVYVDGEGNEVKENMTLGAFLEEFTSEDNESFAKIVTEEQKRHRKKHAWLFQNEALEYKPDDDNTQQPALNYEAKNSLMYVPDGVKLTKKEELKRDKGPKKEISITNTRFPTGHLENQKTQALLSTTTTTNPGATPAPQPPRRGGPKSYSLDGREGKETKQYDYVSTPSPAPGVEFTPFMTWGAVEGTPLVLGSDTPAHISSSSFSSGPPSKFKVPETPEREKVGIRLAEKAKKKPTPVRRTNLLHTPGSTRGGGGGGGGGFLTPSRSSKIAGMSPAAQKMLANRSLKSPGLDSQLRASYSSTPSSTPSSRTPSLRTPSSSTPGGGRRTPGMMKPKAMNITPREGSGRREVGGTPVGRSYGRSSSSSSSSSSKKSSKSVTDDLLNL